MDFMKKMVNISTHQVALNGLNVENGKYFDNFVRSMNLVVF